MLINIKLNETIRYIDYVASECQIVRSNSYPNLDGRLEIFQKRLEELRKTAERLSKRIDKYQKARNPEFDTWKQLFQQLTEISGEVQWYRTIELPAYQTCGESDAIFSNLVTSIHQEIGFRIVKPVVSLHQGSWFAAAPTIPTHPLYLLPSSICSDISELPLIFHEMGHICFRIWGDELSQALMVIFVTMIDRKKDEILEIPDPKRREDAYRVLDRFYFELQYQMEELVCDIIGSLLGGPAFSISLTVGLWTTSNNPFVSNNYKYPPLDYRIKTSQCVLEHLDIDNKISQLILDNWKRVQNLSSPPEYYSWIYENEYLLDLIICVEEFLISKGILVYNPNHEGIRQTLNFGAEKLATNSNDYNEWLSHMKNDFLKRFSQS